MGFDRKGIIEKLKALRAHSESAKSFGSEAEAQTFAETMQRLLTQHKIEMSEIETLEEEELNPVDKIRPDYSAHNIKVRRRRVDWMEDLARIVADAHYCRMLIVPGSSIQIFCGKRADAQMAADVFAQLLAAAESLADKEYVKYFYECKDAGDATKARGFRTSFLKGFCRRIGERYFEWREALRAYYAHDQKALAVINRGTRDADEFIEKNITKTAPQIERTRATNKVGFVRGTDKANNADLSGHKKVGSGS